MLEYLPMALSAASSLAGMFGKDDNNEGGITPEMLNMMLGKREYKLDEKAMKRVVDQLNQLRATGQNITPEMYDSLYRAELQTAADTALKRSEMGANIGLRGAAINEGARQFDERLEAGAAGGYGDLAGKGLAMLQEFLKKNKGGDAGGVRSGTTNYTDSSQVPKSPCILVTSCHGRNSEEVNIAREYRNMFMDQDTLRGYYMTSELLIPIMEISEKFKRMVKTALVDSVIEYVKYILEIIPVCSDLAKYETLSFLANCQELGKMIPSYTRENGEVV